MINKKNNCWYIRKGSSEDDTLIQEQKSLLNNRQSRFNKVSWGKSRGEKENHSRFCLSINFVWHCKIFKSMIHFVQFLFIFHFNVFITFSLPKYLLSIQSNPYSFPLNWINFCMLEVFVKTFRTTSHLLNYPQLVDHR